MKKTKKKPRRGLAPTAAEIAIKRVIGYLTPAVAAERFGVSEALVRKWRREWNRDGAVYNGGGGALLCTYKDGANVWVLAEAVKVKALARRGSPLPSAN